MTVVSRPASDLGGEGVRWGVCIVVAVALHVAAAAAIWLHRSMPRMIEAHLPVAMIDLEPLPTPVAAPPPEAPKPPEPEPQKVEEPPPPQVKPAVVLHKPPPPKPVTRPVEKMVEDVPPLPVPFTAPQKFEPAPAPRAVAPSPNAMRNWEGEVMARLDRFKRYPRRAQLRHQEGVVYLRFAVARNGDVLSYALQRSSGVESLDEETLTLIERAKPLPPPPAEGFHDKIELVVPVRYVLR